MNDMSIFIDNSPALDRLTRIFALQKAEFLRDPYPSAEQRIELMQRVPPMLRKYREKILAALAADCAGHSRDQGDLLEILGMFERTKFNIAHVRNWMKSQPREANFITLGSTKAYIRHQPKGVIGNMVAWNFPFDIALGPMLDQLAAGNRVIIKPSDLVPECGRILEQMIAETFDEDRVAVVNGGLELAKAFPRFAWDHLVYTGSGRIGREIMRSAAENLVSVTLELGGKNPVIVGPDRVVDPWTIATISGVKVIKRGQMCVTADYCLVPQAGIEQFTSALTNYMNKNFASENAEPHACGIINDRHVARLQAMVDEARAAGTKVIQIGSDLKPGERAMPFYLVVNPSDDLQLMREEIFGPILAIKTYQTTEDAIAYVNKGDRPLGLYIFSGDPAFVDQVAHNTHSGGVAVNIVALQAGQPSLAFGGSGASGMGKHHGEEAFREFSNARGYVETGKGGVMNWIMPPYGEGTQFLIDKVAYANVVSQLRFALKMLPKNLLAIFQ